MSLSNHWPDCWRDEGHPACRLHRIHELEVENLALRAQLQRERTGHLTPQEPFTTHATHIPCGNPWFTHHGEEPPSATP